MVEIGDRVLVRLDVGTLRPLLVTACGLIDIAPASAREPQLEFRINGTIFCEPDDRSAAAIRTLGQTGTDPARLHGSPDRFTPFCYGESLKEGSGIGEWMVKGQSRPGA